MDVHWSRNVFSSFRAEEYVQAASKRFQIRCRSVASADFVVAGSNMRSGCSSVYVLLFIVVVSFKSRSLISCYLQPRHNDGVLVAFGNLCIEHSY